MEVIGSIDNASGMLTSLGKNRFHLIFTRGKLVIVAPINVRKSLKENSLVMGDPFTNPGGLKSSMSITRESLVHTMEERGAEIEKNLDEFLSENRDDTRIIDYSSISGARLLKGNPFKLPRLIIRTDESEIYFYLHHNNYRGTGKLDREVYDSYLSVLKEALGDKVLTK